ncbi:hypothetical protein EUTSA_v10026890mg [Eutrema salsugineum]|uniref:KIB1-4 beta-propeller domain-containing protein n=1 Tax=Eutrema salsugineum TaxID=72664 RepID=V4LVM0_EUTSA|nr:hypothetical protein EUTSA_v10026890mg [Eutrema salsugineum]
MSQLIISRSRLFKPSVCKHFLRHKNVRLFSATTQTNSGSESDPDAPINSSFSSTPTYPFLLIDYVLNIPHSPDGRVIRIFESDDERLIKSTKILIRDKKLAKEVRHAMTVGFSHHGLGFKLSKNSLDILVDKHNPPDPKSPPACVHLPPLPTENLESKDWIVGVKSWGSQLSLFRPGHQWINIKTSPEVVHPFSSLMYSKKEERFYVSTPGGDYLCCLDLYFQEGDHPEFIDLEVGNLPESVLPQLEELVSGSRTDHLVESPSGEQFLVKCYGNDARRNYKNVETLMHMTSRFMVFRADESWDQKCVTYTEDIGDLCIFLGHSEAFCIPASSCPGLKPNCIYFVGYNYGVYDLTTKTCTTFYTGEDVPLRNLEFPYWPPPVPLNG